MSTSITSNPQNEFWFHVSKQKDIPIAGIIDKSVDVDFLTQLSKKVPKDLRNSINYIADILQANPDLLDTLRVLVGISDKRLYLDLSYEFAKTPLTASKNSSVLGHSFYLLNKHSVSYFKNLIKNKKSSKFATKIIARYLYEKGVVSVLKTFSSLSREQINILIEKLILTKEVQQAEAKRRGHGAEYELAKIVHKLGCQMLPKERYQKPIGHKDPNVDRTTFEVSKKRKGYTWSFDLIINKGEHNYAFIQSLIHTSDPGQYGVNKSDETVQIKKDLIRHNRKNNASKELWGLVDGVGFCENKKDTIDKMLNEFDCFIQMKTLYKAGLRLHKLGMAKIKAIKFDSSFYNRDQYEAMFKKYGSKDIKLLLNKDQVPSNVITAGKALLIV